MKTAGVIFDFYDDPSGSILKEYFATPEELPVKVKKAHILNQEEREVLRDDAYALVMVNEGKVLRKLACVDAGNTMLSMAYFEKAAEALPDEAIHFAANRLMDFCYEFGLEPTALVKTAAAASGMHRERDSFKQPIVGDEADWAARTNLMSLRGGSDSGRVIPTANAMKTAGVTDFFKVLGMNPKTEDLNKAFAAYTKETGKDPKTMSQGDIHKYLLKTKTADAKGPDTARHIGVTAHMPNLQNLTPSSTGMGTPTLVPGPRLEMVDVTGKSAPHKIEKKAASKYALGTKYPLDSFLDVNNAIQYFEDVWTEMDPDDRHEYCVKTASRAEELGMDVPEMMQRYGSQSYAPDLEAYMVSRMTKCASEYKGAYEELYNQRSSLGPEEFATVLAKVDAVAGMDRLYGNHIMDPWFSTFGGMSEKVAEESWTWKSNTGDLVSSEQINWLAREGRGLVMKQFSKEIADAFCKNPIPIFDSLPETQKKILCNMANTKFDGPSSN